LFVVVVEHLCRGGVSIFSLLDKTSHNESIIARAYLVADHSLPSQNLVVPILVASHTLWQKQSIWLVAKVWQENSGSCLVFCHKCLANTRGNRLDGGQKFIKEKYTAITENI
jgi:hypothetical protein